ncbi:MAG: hypothetical protein M3437_17320 [Chloroflexota bacterium]|nr:hypothetical protein [Chloroflexota bacterium]MDQ5868050.1 hypothetical protein [Chloroflexota bacterium]
MSTLYDTDNSTDDETPLYCYNHPNEPTYLRCGKCERPICARCRVSTPVGFRCFECANLQVLPTYALDSSVYLKAAMFGLVAAGLTGVLLGLFPAFEFWGALLMGITVPEAVARASNQKRGPGLQMVGIGCLAFGFILSRFVSVQWPDLIPLGDINVQFLTGIGLFDRLPFYLTQYTVLWMLLAVFLTYKRLQ